MSTPPTPLPVINRDDSGVAVLNRWVTATPDEQRSVAEASLAAWANAPWPEGLLAVNCFVSTNGDTVLTYEQWSSEQQLRAFDGAASAAGREGIDREIAADAPSAERSEPFVCRLHRSSIMNARSAPTCVVITTFAFEQAETARAWSDAICHADATQPEPTPGSISRHFLLSLDGTQVLNYSEWLDEESHRKFLENPAQTPEWRKVEEFTGLTHGPGRRCRPYGGLAAPLVD
jgi:heme-degrading monooxygenase HmoA